MIEHRAQTTYIEREYRGVSMKRTWIAFMFLALPANLAFAQIGAGALTRSMTVTVHGDYVAAGTGLEGVEHASIVIDTIPDGADVVGGVLYWGLLDDESRAEHARIRINGNRVVGKLAGSTGGCWSRTRSFVYRARLTAEQLGRDFEPVGEDPIPPPPGNGIYELSGYRTQDPTVPQGATLVLIYRHESSRARDIVFYDGNVAPTPFPPPPFFRDAEVEIHGFLAQAPVEASSTFVVGNGDPEVQDLLYFVTQNGSIRIIGFSPLDSSDGATWDTETVDLDGAVEPGDSFGTAILRSYSVRVGRLFGIDCTFWAAQVTSVTTSRPVDADPTVHFEERILVARTR